MRGRRFEQQRSIRLPITIGLLLSCLISACDLWPKNLEPLAEAIAREVAGEAEAWLLGGDVVVIDVVSAQFDENTQAELELLATGFAENAVKAAPKPLESVAITFHDDHIADTPADGREFIFLVMDGRPVLQAFVGAGFTGPLTEAEIQAAVDRAEAASDSPAESFGPAGRDCILKAMTARARELGDPESLDVASVEYLSSATWSFLDASGRRLFLSQAILTEALFSCASSAVQESG